MIHRVEISYFKKFKEIEFSLPHRVVIVGPNNSGKTSLLQAIATWSELANIWLQSYGDYPVRDEDGNYKTVKVNLEEFGVLELSNYDELWWNRVAETPVSIKVSSENWKIGLNLIYEEPKVISVRPMPDVTEDDLKVFTETHFSASYIQSLSGLDAKEPFYEESVISSRLARGKGGSVLRSMLYKVSQDDQGWERLQKDIDSFFGYELSTPSGSDPIWATYRHNPTEIALNYASGASGFLQTVLILSALQFKDVSILLVDEPDVHLHTLLKEKIYRYLRQHCESRNCQLIIATHSNFLIEAASREENDALQIIGDKGLTPVRREDAHELMRLPTEHVIYARIQKSLLYLEGKSDFDILREWAKVLEHPVSINLEQVFCVFTAEMRGKKRNAKKHFNALKSLVPDLTALDIRDRNDKYQSTRVNYEPGNLKINDSASSPEGYINVIWTRYEIENYLIHPKTLERYVRKNFGQDRAERAKEYLNQQLPKHLHHFPFESTLGDAAGKARIQEFLVATDVNIKASEYYRIASEMKKDEIHPEVVDMLDLINQQLNGQARD